MERIDQLAWTGCSAQKHHGFPITFTYRQREVLLLLCEGLPNKTIARRLHVSDATVKSHVASVLRSMNVATRLEAVTLAFTLGLVRPLRAGETAEADRPRPHSIDSAQIAA